MEELERRPDTRDIVQFPVPKRFRGETIERHGSLKRDIVPSTYWEQRLHICPAPDSSLSGQRSVQSDRSIANIYM